MIPILLNHDSSAPPIGKVRVIDDLRLEIELFSPFTREQIFQVFGDAGIRILDSERDGEAELVLRFEILEFSYCPAAAENPKPWSSESERPACPNCGLPGARGATLAFCAACDIAYSHQGMIVASGLKRIPKGPGPRYTHTDGGVAQIMDDLKSGGIIK